jgi:hypothetical protein
MRATVLACLVAYAAAEEGFVWSGKNIGSDYATIKVRAEGCNDPDKSGGCGVASIWKDNVKVSTSGRGHNVVVFDPVNFSVLKYAAFDTYGDSNGDDNLYSYINTIGDGQLVAIATQDEYTSQLTHGDLFHMMKRDFGCRQFDDKDGEYGEEGFRGSYAFLGYKKGDRLAERYAPRYMGSTQFELKVPAKTVNTATDNHIMVRSEGCNDPDRTGCGQASIWVNGVQEASRGRGHNIVVVDPATKDVVDRQSFDTHGNSGADEEMLTFLNNIATGHLTIIACQDEYTNAFDNSETMNVLRRDFGAGMGGFPIESDYRSSWLLVSKKMGESYANRFAESAKGSTTWEMHIPIELSRHGVNELDLVVRSEGCNDPGISGCGMAKIWVDGTDRSPHGRGHNIVVIDEKTGQFIKATSFDTHGDSNADNNMNSYLANEVSDYQIVAIAVQDEGTNTFADDSDVFNLLARDFGAVKPLETDYRSSWLLVAAKRGEVFAQRVAESGKGTTNVHLKIPLQHVTPAPTPSPTPSPTPAPTPAPTWRK